MNFAINILLPYVIATSASSSSSVVNAQATDNINGLHTVYAGDHYADCSGIFCFSGPNWGDNGQFEWYVKVTFSQSAVSYSGTSCFSNTVEYYDWNKLWGKARCGYSHNHQQDSDRFVWRRLQDLHSPANCGGLANCTGIQLGTYSYDGGTTPYPNENWALSKTFSTILQPDIPYVLGMESFSDGTVLHSLYSSDWTLLEAKTNVHSNLCSNYEQGSVLGLYFGGTCTAPDDIAVTYEALTGPTTPGPSVSPTRKPSSSPTGIPVPTFNPTKAPTGSPTIPKPTSSPTKTPSIAPTPPASCGNNTTKEDCEGTTGCEWVGKRNKVCQATVNTTTPSPTAGVTGNCDPQGISCSGSTNNCCSGECGTKGKWTDKCK